MWIYLILRDAKGNRKIIKSLACTSLFAERSDVMVDFANNSKT